MNTIIHGTTVSYSLYYSNANITPVLLSPKFSRSTSLPYHPRSHTALALSPQSCYHPCLHVSPVLVHMGQWYYNCQRLRYVAPVPMYARFHGFERANSRVSRVVLSSLAKTAVLCSADSADVMAVEEPVQPRQSRQSLQMRGITTTLTVLTALTQR